VKSNSAYVIAKADFTVGTAAELGERLAKLPPKRYAKGIDKK